MIESDWLGRIGYAAGLEHMESIRARVRSSGGARLLLLEHDPVITLGRSADRRNVHLDDVGLRRRGIQLVETRRGGDVTYHGPGQLVIYPIVRVRRILALMRAVAGGIAQVAARHGVRGAVWQRDPAGVWVNGSKLAACGIHVSRGVSGHGFALNVTTPPDVWRSINPCGLGANVMTSLAEQGAPPDTTVESVAQIAAECIIDSLSTAADEALR